MPMQEFRLQQCILQGLVVTLAGFSFVEHACHVDGTFRAKGTRMEKFSYDRLEALPLSARHWAALAPRMDSRENRNAPKVL